MSATVVKRISQLMFQDDPSTMDAFKDLIDIKTCEALKEIGDRVKNLLQDICSKSDFPKKYDLSSQPPGEPFLYLLSTFNSPYRFTLEAFSRVIEQNADDLNKRPENFIFHETLEAAIARYTNSSSKPNQLLEKTRSTDFCHTVTIHIEAIPHNQAKKPLNFLLLREYQVLIAIWENYLQDLKQKKCAADQLVGFLMPFEFCCVTGTEYDLVDEPGHSYYNIHGALTSFKTIESMPMSENTVLNSTLSYIAVEKLGPSVKYLTDLMKSASKPFSLSSALKIYDQLICRLMVLHRYSIVHGDLNTECLRFGSSNTCNVLYISEFSSCIALPSKSTPAFYFHDRFVSSQRIKTKSFHFVQDLESAFYIFFSLAMGGLPWDRKVKKERRSSVSSLSKIKGLQETNLTVNVSNTRKDKESFWDSPDLAQRIINSKEYEIEGALYSNFIVDLMMSLYQKMREILSSVSIHQEIWLQKDTLSGSNAYLGLRKTIASYFRFETLYPFLMDTVTGAKIALLKSLDTADHRVAWDLSSWCWNSIYIEEKYRISEDYSLMSGTYGA